MLHQHLLGQERSTQRTRQSIIIRYSKNVGLKRLELTVFVRIWTRETIEVELFVRKPFLKDGASLTPRIVGLTIFWHYYVSLYTC